jgi:hypothetical protein
LRELNAVYLEERRNEALAVVTLIKDAAFKKEREEIEINGNFNNLFITLF